jgi:DNA-binding CsgD family transcriptional regulator
MNFWNTQMHMVTFSIVIFELAMLFFQIIYFLERKSDKQRLLYLILLLLLIIYNVISGLFPDPNIPVPVTLQSILAFLVGFTTSMYVVYYFYKAFELPQLKFFATWGSLLFLFVPFLGLFVAPFLLTGDSNLSRKLVVIIPFFYGLVFIYVCSRAMYAKYASAHKGSTDLIIATYIALLCWATLPVIVFTGDHQLIEHSITNAGFLLMTIVYVRTSINNARKEYRLLVMKVEEKDREIEQLTANKLTSREKEVLALLIKGRKNKQIADELFISEGTAAKHVSNILKKCGVETKVELMYKLSSGSQSEA